MPRVSTVLTPERLADVGEESRKLRERLGLSQAQLARRAVVSSSVVSQIDTQSYPVAGDSAAVMSVEATIEDLKRQELTLGDDVPFCRLSATRPLTTLLQGARDFTTIAVAVGRTGLGKSRLLLQTAADHGRRLLYLSCTLAESSPKALFGQVCEIERLPTGGTLGEQLRRLTNQLKGTDRCVIFDDAHYLSDRALLAVQGLHERAKVPIVLVGNPFVWDRIFGPRNASEPRFMHLAGRALFKVALSDEIPRSDVQIIARAALRDVDDEVIERLHQAAQGPHGLRAVVVLCRLARKIAEPDGRSVKRRDIEVAEALMTWTVGK